METMCTFCKGVVFVSYMFGVEVLFSRVPTGFGILELFRNFIYPFQGPG